MNKDEIKFKEFVDNLKVGVFRCTPGLKGKFLFTNAAFREMFGYNAQEVFKIFVEDLLKDHRKLKSILKRIRTQGFLEKEQIRLKGKDCRPFWGSMTWVAIKEKKGRVKYFDVLIEDISVQKHIEKELSESKELFRVVFDNSAAAITVIDQNEKILAWNPFAEKMLEMNKKDLFNKPIKELYPPQEWRRLRSLRIRHRGMLSDIETRIYKKDGSLLDVNMSISVLKNTSGHFYGAIGIMRDITHQKIAERKIRESENKIRIILDNSAAAITLTDENERIVSWNSYTEHLLGYKKKDLDLMPVSSLYPPQEWAKIRSENIRKTGSRHHLQTKALTKSGRVIDIDLSINVLKDANGKILGSVGIMQDITEQKQFQQMLLKAKLAAEEANNAKSLFLANMSHEVRTPMSTIMGMIDLTLDTQLGDEQKDNLKIAKDAADNLLSLLNDILDLSRVEAGKINLECIEFNLSNIVQSVCQGLSVLARNKDLELSWHIDADVPEFLEGDPVRVRQVLVNLINNAIKFTHQGKIETQVKIFYRSEQECQLLFSVADSGIGIPKDKQEMIFDVFTQADDSTTRRYGGTGLGLAISKRLVEMMGGRIWVESEASKGSTFFFTAAFKYKKEAPAIRDVPKTESISEKQSFPKEIQNLRILLAEDNLVNQKIAVKILEKQGWRVFTAVNGREVLDLLAHESFDLVLMDAQMPVLDGVETTRLIREDEKKTGKYIPIVALTARAMEEDRQRCLSAGMDDYVPKPIDRLQLFEVIENIFKKVPTSS